jgi:hypothetical protein
VTILSVVPKSAQGAEGVKMGVHKGGKVTASKTGVHLGTRVYFCHFGTNVLSEGFVSIVNDSTNICGLKALDIAEPDAVLVPENNCVRTLAVLPFFRCLYPPPSEIPRLNPILPPIKSLFFYPALIGTFGAAAMVSTGVL